MSYAKARKYNRTVKARKNVEQLASYITCESRSKIICTAVGIALFLFLKGFVLGYFAAKLFEDERI